MFMSIYEAPLRVSAEDESEVTSGIFCLLDKCKSLKFFACFSLFEHLKAKWNFISKTLRFPASFYRGKFDYLYSYSL